MSKSQRKTKKRIEDLYQNVIKQFQIKLKQITFTLSQKDLRQIIQSIKNNYLNYQYYINKMNNEVIQKQSNKTQTIISNTNTEKLQELSKQQNNVIDSDSDSDSYSDDQQWFTSHNSDQQLVQQQLIKQQQQEQEQQEYPIDLIQQQTKYINSIKTFNSKTEQWIIAQFISKNIKYKVKRKSKVKTLEVTLKNAIYKSKQTQQIFRNVPFSCQKIHEIPQKQQSIIYSFHDSD